MAKWFTSPPAFDPTPPPGGDRPAILHLEQLTRQFSPHEPPAVDGVSLTLQAGDLLALLGPSGCGKTTLLRLVAGFERPQTGMITVNGQPVAGGGHWVPPEARRLGMVFQDYALFPHLTVAENVAFGLTLDRKRTSDQVRSRVSETLALVGLDTLSRRYPHELSGGQQQRVALARALAPQPALVLLDEPLSNLDAQVRQRLRLEIRQILQSVGASGIFVTHDREEAMAISDRVGVMRQGRLEQIDTPEQIYWQPRSRFVAAFVAQTNFVPARRRESVWDTPLGVFGGQVIYPQGTVDRGDLAVRPTELSLRSSHAQGTGQLPGQVRVMGRQFLGREYAYTVKLADHQALQVMAPPSVVLEPGAIAQITFATERLPLFPPDPLPSSEVPPAVATGAGR